MVGNQILSSYPIFKELYGTSFIISRKAVIEFAMRFKSRWLDPQTTFHETISERNHVVLLWSFQGRNSSTHQAHSWGGITLFRFSSSGKIVTEIGEESEFGPFV